MAAAVDSTSPRPVTSGATSTIGSPSPTGRSLAGWAGMTEAVEGVEFTDPWCSWAWGTEPKLRRLQWRWGDRVVWRRVLGDLVPRRPPPDDVAGAAARTAGYWEKVHAHTGQPWPVHLRWPPGGSDVA